MRKPAPKSCTRSGVSTRYAAGRGQLFESIHGAYLSDLRAGMNGLAMADLNRDGLTDIVEKFSPPRGSGGQWGKGELLRVFINEGGFQFRTHAVELRDSQFTLDVREPLLDYWPGEYRQRVFCWKNLLAETSQLHFEKVTGNGLACEARLRYDRDRQIYVPEGTAPDLPYLATANVDNDGWLDLVVQDRRAGRSPRARHQQAPWHQVDSHEP